MMAKVFRLMKADQEGFPRVANNAVGLGARIPKDIDVVDDLVVINEKGMSVRPRWQNIPLDFLPKRLDPAGLGEDANRVFTRGEGDFDPEPFAPGLVLVPDSPKHGLVKPAAPVTLDQYRADLAATRTEWTDIEK